MSISYDERNWIFGNPGDHGRTTVIETPWGVKVRIHVAILDVFVAACIEACTLPWKPKRIDSYSVRPIRGSRKPSLHGYGLGFDFFATNPGIVPAGGVWKPHNTVPAEFARCFTRRGFYWGRNFKRQDWPHIEWADGIPSLSQLPLPPVTTSTWEEELIAMLKVLDLSPGSADCRHGLVDNVQALLVAVKRKDCDPGGIDGIAGDDTRRALLHFRKLTGRPDWNHPVVDQDVWKRLVAW